MKRLLTGFGVVVMALMASPSSATMIVGGAFDGTDVGLEDWLEGVADKTTISLLCGPGGDPSVELCWAESILGGTTDFTVKTETVPIYQTDAGASVIAFQLFSSPSYFLVKNSTYSALYTNKDLRDWGVIDTDDLPVGKRWTLKFGQLAKVESRPRKRSLACHGRDGVIPLS